MVNKGKILEKVANIGLNILIFIFGIVLLISIYNNIQVKLLGNDYSSFFGYSVFEVQTGSMKDAINPGDMIVVKNEPDIKFEATTHKVKLDEETIKANARFFEHEEDVPKYAISMGIKTIMLAKKIILLASGKNKAEAIYKAVYGSVRPDAPASILQLHQDVVVIVDKDAASLLPEKDKKVFVK